LYSCSHALLDSSASVFLHYGIPALMHSCSHAPHTSALMHYWIPSLMESLSIAFRNFSIPPFLHYWIPSLMHSRSYALTHSFTRKLRTPADALLYSCTRKFMHSSSHSLVVCRECDEERRGKAAMGGVAGAQCPDLRVNLSKKTGARSASKNHKLANI
jgi:hypothetical protein